MWEIVRLLILLLLIVSVVLPSCIPTIPTDMQRTVSDGGTRYGKSGFAWEMASVDVLLVEK